MYVDVRFSTLLYTPTHEKYSIASYILTAQEEMREWARPEKSYKLLEKSVQVMQVSDIY